MIIVVTGSASGLGLEISTTLLAGGHTVIGVDVAEQPLGGTKDFISAKVDVASSMSGQRVAKIADDCLPMRHEPITGLINCAGINRNSWFDDVSVEELERVMDVNAFSIVWMTQGLLDDLRESEGFVLNIVSNAAHIPMTSSLAYNASKAAALMITKQMAHELTKTHGITVFSISPNKLEGTAMSKQIEDNVCQTRGWTAEYAAEYQKKALMHGLETDPKAIAGYIQYLLDSGSWKFMSGTDIPFGK